MANSKHDEFQYKYNFEYCTCDSLWDWWQWNLFPESWIEQLYCMHLKTKCISLAFKVKSFQILADILQRKLQRNYSLHHSHAFLYKTIDSKKKFKFISNNLNEWCWNGMNLTKLLYYWSCMLYSSFLTNT